MSAVASAPHGSSYATAMDDRATQNLRFEMVALLIVGGRLKRKSGIYVGGVSERSVVG